MTCSEIRTPLGLSPHKLRPAGGKPAGSTSFLNVLALLLVTLMLNSGCDRSTRDDSTPGVSTERQRLAAIAERVTILRDDFGVPHIYAPTDADAVFGLLYAQAEDDFPRIERNYVWAIGRLAEVLGEAALYSDLRARLYMSTDEARAAYAAAPDWLQALCNAFADGLNYYLMTHPEVTPQLLGSFEPWMPFYFFEGSIGGDIEQIPLEGIEAFYSLGRRVEETLPSRETPIAAAGADLLSAQGSPAVSVTERFAEPRGSNGIAVAGQLTASGAPMLLINPHTSFFFRGEAHVVSEEGLNAYGAVTWGQFFIYQGFNEHTGWMHTSTSADFMDEFVQRIVRDDSGLYSVYGEERRPVTISEVTLKIREASGTRQHTFPIYRTHQGPVTHRSDSHWVTSRINWDPVNALRQSYLRMKNTSYAEFRQMMDIRTNSSNNTVYADSTGNIAYFHGNFMPRRNPDIDYEKPVDGSDPATDWAGLHSLDETVQLLNPPNGWIQNANSTPFTAAGAHSPNRADFPHYMAPDEENHRAVHAVRVLEEARDLTLEGLIELAYDPWLPGFEKLIAGLIDAYDSRSDPGSQLELAPAIDVLRQWDMKVGLDSVAMSLAHYYGLNMLEGVTLPAGYTRMATIDWLGTGSDPQQRLEIFAATLQELTADFGSWATPWGEINRYQRLDGALEPSFDDSAPSLGIPMASGNWGALASFGAPRRDDVRRLYGTAGNSFVAVVEFGDRIRAKSLLAGGQSGSPDSPHFSDQAGRYAAADFKDVAFYREDVERRAVRRYHPGTDAVGQ